MVALNTIVVRNAGVLDVNVGGETVLMSIESGTYHALKATSRAIWGRLKEPVSVEELCLDLADTYQVPLDTVKTDTLEFLGVLEAQKMIEARHSGIT